jgi:hypothetical protein
VDELLGVLAQNRLGVEGLPFCVFSHFSAVYRIALSCATLLFMPLYATALFIAITAIAGYLIWRLCAAEAKRKDTLTPAEREREWLKRQW